VEPRLYRSAEPIKTGSKAKHTESMDMSERCVSMPFRKVNEKEEVNKRLRNDPELKKAYNYAQYEYEVVKQFGPENKDRKEKCKKDR
jgi:hypothetical protein